MTDQIIAALAANGPMSLLLGGIIYVIWGQLKAKERELKALQAHYDGDPTDATKVGRIAQLRADSQKREDALREAFQKREDSVMEELLATLKSIENN